MASEIIVDNITGKTGTSGGAPLTLSGDTATLGSGATLGSAVTFPAGHIIQVLQTVKTSDSNTQSTSLIDLPGMSVDITPKKSTSKILT